MPNRPANSAKFPSAQAGLGRQWNVKIQSEPNPVTNHHPHPVLLLLFSQCWVADLAVSYLNAAKPRILMRTGKTFASMTA